MARHDDRGKAIWFERPEYIPVSVSLLPGAWIKYRQDLDALVARHPVIFGRQQPQADYDAMAKGRYRRGRYVDAWGCVWSNVRTGMDAIVTEHPVPTREAVRTLKAPQEDAGLPHGFMYLRLCDLRGFEEIMLDFADEPPELQMLIDLVLEYNVRQMHKYVDGLDHPQEIGFGDDLGTQHGLAIGPEKWRRYLKPCYSKLYGIAIRAGHWITMHTDGCMWEIIPDLIDCGVKTVNPQVRANGLDNLARVCKGKVCVNLDLDRQMFPFCTPAEIDAHVCEAVEKLGLPTGGLMLGAECAPDVPLENIEAICCALEKYRGAFRPGLPG